MTYDAALWGAVACTLTTLGGVLSYLAWQRRGAAAGLRGIAWSLLPVAAWLTGTLRLLAEVLGDVGRWAVHLVFSPVVWLGIVLAGVAVVLFGVSGVLRGRRDGAGEAPAVERGSQRRQPDGGQSTKPDKGHGRKRANKQVKGSRAADDLENGDEIEAILRKHGIR